MAARTLGLLRHSDASILSCCKATFILHTKMLLRLHMGTVAENHLASTSKKQARHSLFDISMAKDVGSNPAKDLLMQIGLCCKCFEFSLFLHPA